jgi:hypothetical protein
MEQYESLTIFWFEISMQDHNTASRCSWFRSITQSHDITPNFRRVNAIVTPVKGSDQLSEHAPHKALFRVLFLDLKVFDDATEISISTIFHIEVEVLSGLQVFSVVVSDDVWVSKRRENRKLGV